MAEDSADSRLVTVFVASLPWRRAWVAAFEMWRLRRMVRRVSGVRFARCAWTCGGTGTRDLGATLSLRRQLVLVEWHSRHDAAAGIERFMTYWGDREAEVWTASMVPTKSKGSWESVEAFRTGADADPNDAMIAVLSYGKVKWLKIFTWYYRGLPKAQRAAAALDSGMSAGIGFTDVPLRHACTLSFWPSSTLIAKYAYPKGSPHGEVQRRASDQQWFSETLFARFAVVEHSGSWSGHDPLAVLAPTST